MYPEIALGVAAADIERALSHPAYLHRRELEFQRRQARRRRWEARRGRWFGRHGDRVIASAPVHGSPGVREGTRSTVREGTLST